MKKPTKAYKMGVLAWQENQSKSSNPFKKGTKEFILVGAENPSPLGDGMNATHRK